MVDTLQLTAWHQITIAVHDRICLRTCRFAATHLEVPVDQSALNQQPGCYDDEWLHKEDDTQRRVCRGRSACELEITRSRENDTALHDMVDDEGVKRARGS